MKNNEILKKLLERYNFITSIADEIQRFVVSSRARVLISSLKAVGDFSLIYGLAVRIYFRARRIGLRPSISASRVIAYIISVTFICALAAGAFHLTRIYLPDYIDKEKSQKQFIDEEIKPQKDEKKKVEIIYNYGVPLFTAKNVERDIVIKATDIVAGEMARLINGRSVVNLRKTRQRVKNIISGSIVRLGTRYIITAKIIEVETMKVKYGATESAGSPGELDDACRRLAGSLAGE